MQITFGGWYQRTTLHLSEIFDFLALGKTNLNLDRAKIAENHSRLNLESVTRETGSLEYVKAKTKDSIEIRYYEDGLYVLETQSEDVLGAKKKLEDYFLNILNPAVSYIFSLGAPTPKILANIKTVHPTVISTTSGNPSAYNFDSEKFGDIYQKIESHDGQVIVFKAPLYIFVIAKPEVQPMVRDIVEMQIFFREFKDQLEKYLNIHRNLWEEISAIKEQKSVRGSDVEILRARLDGYQKTISLITNRINQMGSYVRTRSSISKGLNIEQYLVGLFQFKFEVLLDTLDYIKELWKMTLDYLSSAIQNIVEIKNQSTGRSIQSLQLITSLGVISGLVGYFGRDTWPQFTGVGTGYFFIVIVAAWLVNFFLIRLYTRKKYNLHFGERISDI